VPSGDDGGYGDEAATVAIDDVLYVACAVYAMVCLIGWTWVAGNRALARHLFTLPRLSALGRPLTLFFLALLPAALIAVQTVRHADRYHALVTGGGEVTLEALLAVAFDALAAFGVCAQLWFGVALQVQLYAFELGQDRQRYTRKLYFLYTPSLPSSSSSSSGEDAAKEAEEENRARKKAFELSMDPTYAGFTKSVMVRP
jgi:hypothetical protein